ncbi:MAG: YggT family protein [Proteobacteria bacterium]|nr:YggT family protein [Pseudomonadota bacterium]
MFIIGNLIHALAAIIHWALTIYMWLIIARAVISWVNPDPYNPVVRFLYQVTEPVLYRVRRFLPIGRMPIDLSPVVVFLAIFFLDAFLVRTLEDIAIRMR